jgi:hypothetical protein
MDERQVCLFDGSILKGPAEAGVRDVILCNHE